MTGGVKRAVRTAGGTETSSRIWTVPNVLSFLRLLLLPIFLWLLLGPEEEELAVGVLVLIGLSDYLDGYLARRLNQMSRLGALLDPVADRLYILTAVVGLGVRGILPLWLVLLLPARDLFLWFLVPLLRTRGYSALPVHFLGKAATAALIYAFPLLLLGEGESSAAIAARVLGWAFVLWGVGMYWWAGILYGWQVHRLLRSTAPRGAIPDG